MGSRWMLPSAFFLTFIPSAKGCAMVLPGLRAGERMGKDKKKWKELGSLSPSPPW